MFQFLPALLLLLLQSAPADRGPLALAWYTLQALRIELSPQVQVSEPGPVVKESQAVQANRTYKTHRTYMESRRFAPAPQPTEGSQESSRSRDGPAFV